MKLYVGNSSQMKNMNEKQREAISKWFDVVTEEEEQQKQKRKFTERERDEHGKFIKKQDDQAKKFIGMASAVKGMFKTMTVGVATGIGNMATGIKTHFMNFFSALKSQFLGLFGEESEWFELLGSIKDSIKSFAGSMARGFLAIFRRTPAWASKQLKILKDMYKLQVKQMKMDFLDATGGKKKNKIWQTLAVILVAIAAGIGAWLHRKLIAITSSMKVFSRIGAIFSKFNKLPALTKIANGFTKLKGWFGKFMQFIGKIPILSQMLKGLKFGFKWLGWPVTLLLSIVDFIKGFKDAEGTLWEKIQGGLWKALEGFIELPIRFVGWVTEKVLGFLGIQVDGVGDKMMESLKTIFDFLTDFNPFAPIVDFIQGFFNTEGNIGDKLAGGAGNALEGMQERLNKWFSPLMEAITPFVSGIAGFVSELWSGFVNWAKDKIPDWLPGKESALNALAGGGGAIGGIEPVTATNSPVEAASKKETAKIENSNETARKMEESNQLLKEMQRNSKNDATRNTLNAMSNNNQGSQGGDTKQIPDEIDNNLVSVRNYSGELD
jgi:hypothetical protein